MDQSKKYFFIGLFFLICGIAAIVWAVQNGFTFSRALVFIMFFFFAYIFIKNAVLQRRR